MPYYPPPEGFGAPGMSQFGPPMTPEHEIAFLRDHAQMLKQQMDQIDARIKELEKGIGQISFERRSLFEQTKNLDICLEKSETILQLVP